jgi:DnaJ-class molecular chaperone
MRDPYTVLGVGRLADAAEIKSAYRKAAKKHHPDQNAGDPKAQQRFAEINQAHEILSDPAKRDEFDRGLIGNDGKPTAPKGGAGFRGGGNPFEGFGGFGGGNSGDRRRSSGADDILSELFGAGFGPAQEKRKPKQNFTPPAGNDINISTDVTLEDIASGKAELDLPTGARIAFSIPKGVVDGQVVRLKGKGYSSPTGGAAGDANITIRFKQDAKRRVDGTNVTVDVMLPFDVAVLGGKVPVDTPRGRIALTIPPMTDGDRVFRLKERGLDGKNGARGDLLITVRIMLPKNADRDLARDLTTLAEAVRAKA